ncbi:cell division FtsA domain-containing protein [Syntrophomonas palmitatica]|uniref:cell division FtsA domain-containing protein n=1 Tax=Syntrophomonas palmitatica TaxID=402877 RepID=UPI0006D22589|nr:cell division FtsA domain-containing protein [Syntrophomonas palmitatica]
MKDKQVFALDIGTRKIVGLLMEKTAAGYQVVDAEIREHNTRAMLDGQIHDVEAVAEIIKEIKDTLENRLECTFENAAVAAAGRALKTARGTVRKKRNRLIEMSRDEVRALEVEAVQQAQYQLTQDEKEKGESANYFCVGYSVIRCLLEGQEIGSLVGQIGQEAAVEVIATFLPRVVVDSLFSSLRRADLGIQSLTLEPIAALSVAIPPAMRLLNLALVDIGAGTSDIAIVKDGKISAYAMVPIGGDEISEFIAGEYLLDFNSAEIIKRRLSELEEIELVDILGNRSRMASKEIINRMQDLVNDLARSIAQNILALNQKAPSAVLCVGGGSLTPDLTRSLALHLELPANRVGIRTPENFDSIMVNSDFLKGPQGVTPLGIAYNYFTIPPVPFTKIKVNGREISLWNIGEINVGTALLSSGIALNNIYGRPGLGKSIEINGVVRIIKGEVGAPPLIKVNSQDASLETPVKENDEIEFAPGMDGKDASIKARDLVPAVRGQVLVNGDLIDLEPVILIDGRRCSPDEEIPDRARVEFKSVNSLANILLAAGLSPHWLEEKNLRYYLNGQEMFLRWTAVEVWVNGEKARIEQEVAAGADIKYSTRKLWPLIADVAEEIKSPDMVVKVNGEEVRLIGQGICLTSEGQPVALDQQLTEGMKLELDTNKGGAILSDIFQVINIKPGLNGRLSLKVNGQDAGYTTPIYNNCEIELIWEN